MVGSSDCGEAAARHFELAAQHRRMAAERAAGGDKIEAAHLDRVADALAARGYRYALHAARRTLTRLAVPDGD